MDNGKGKDSNAGQTLRRASLNIPRGLDRDVTALALQIGNQFDFVFDCPERLKDLYP